MRIITPRDVDPGAERRGPRLPARPAPAALGVPPHVARARSALRVRRHPARAAPQRVGVRPARQPVTNNYAEKRNEPPRLPGNADPAAGLSSQLTRVPAHGAGPSPPAPRSYSTSS